MKQDNVYLASGDDSSAPDLQNAPAEGSGIEMGSMSQVRTLVAINQRKNLETALAYLERNYYQLQIVNKIPDLIKGLQTHRPQVVLLSWNLKNTDIKRVYRLLTQKFHIICIVFAEDSTTRTTASLMSSGIPHSLLAPVSGPSIHMRIQSLLAPRMRPRKRPVVPKLFKKPMNKIPVDKTTVPSNLVWQEIADPDNTDKMWKGINPGGSASGNIYYFKGAVPPTFDKTKQEWQYSTSKGGIFMEERPNSPEFSAVQEGIGQGEEYKVTTSNPQGEMMEAVQKSSLDKDFDWDAVMATAAKDLAATQTKPGSESESDLSEIHSESRQKNSVIFQEKPESKKDSPIIQEKAPAKGGSSLGEIIDINPDIKSRNPQAGESLLAQCLRVALTQRPGAPNSMAFEKAAISNMTVCTIVSDRFCGYIVCVSSDNTHQKIQLMEIMDLAIEELKNSGEKLLRPLEFLEVSTDAVPFMPWADKKADFSILAKKSGLALAFFSTGGQPQMIEAQDESVLGILLEKDIMPDATVLFNVYIHLPKNTKYLLYLQKGQVFTKNMRNKFIGFGIKTLYIRKVEKEAFLTYCARNFLKSSLK